MDKYLGTVNIEPQNEYTTEIVAVSGGVSENGQLKVVGTQLCNEKGEAVVLRGMSSHGLQWFPQFVSSDYIKAVGARGANVMRFAMYTSENGYISNHYIKNTLTKAVDNAISNDMYAIIDWHILSDGNPNLNKEEAKAFFSEMADKYAGHNNVIYEICNEPNGGVQWKTIKSYAKSVIKVIRKADKNAVVIVGTPTWSQDVDMAAKSPLKGKNIMYAFHFYAATHGDDLRAKVNAALRSKLPLFCSEFSACDASGNGNYDFSSANKWISLMNRNKISYCCWSLSNKPESASLLKSSCKKTSGFSVK